tara:strand:+ start:829 stop:1455 length:627 start_codon:yes stop_codon:yes gene_type:complete
MENLASLLPENLTEEAIGEIANIVDSVITEQVNERVQELEDRVHSFLRLKMDSIKEQALQELREEDETFKNAQSFEYLKSLMAIELNEGDSESAVAIVSKEAEELAEENQLIIRELNDALTENAKLENTVKVYHDKLALIEEQNETLQESVEHLEDVVEKPFKSSERALVISEEVDSETTQERTHNQNNEFLTEDVMAYMPFNETRRN